MVLQNKSQSHIDVVMSCDGLKTKPWRFTGFYEEPRRDLRKNSWYLLRFFRKQLDLPWLCAGDFNEVLLPEEHFGASERESWQIAGFQELVVDCEFVDLGYSGLPYTWDNWQAGAHNVKTRLDRVFGDHRFLDAMGESAVKILPTVFSDHAAVLIEVKVQTVTRGWRRKKKPSDMSTCGSGMMGTRSSSTKPGRRHRQGTCSLWLPPYQASKLP